MLNSDYGSEHQLDPVQLTQISWDPYLQLSLSRDRERLFPVAQAPAEIRLREVGTIGSTSGDWRGLRGRRQRDIDDNSALAARPGV